MLENEHEVKKMTCIETRARHVPPPRQGPRQWLVKIQVRTTQPISLCCLIQHKEPYRAFHICSSVGWISGVDPSAICASNSIDTYAILRVITRWLTHNNSKSDIARPPQNHRLSLMITRYLCDHQRRNPYPLLTNASVYPVEDHELRRWCACRKKRQLVGTVAFECSGLSEWSSYEGIYTFSQQ